MRLDTVPRELRRDLTGDREGVRAQRMRQYGDGCGWCHGDLADVCLHCV
jgi:hypothetical protein